MAIGAKHPCSKRGCRVLIERGQRFCPGHEVEDRNRQEQGRLSAADRGYNARWNRESREWLMDHPWCVECARQGLQVVATVVDHAVPARVAPDRFYDRTNWQPLCKRHHDIKTAREDGRWS
jgi:5-methylcytosine-specific restriction enzyme A